MLHPNALINEVMSEIPITSAINTIMMLADMLYSIHRNGFTPRATLCLSICVTVQAM